MKKSAAIIAAAIAFAMVSGPAKAATFAESYTQGLRSVADANALSVRVAVDAVKNTDRETLLTFGGGFLLLLGSMIYGIGEDRKMSARAAPRANKPS